MPPAGILRGRGGGQEEHERRDSRAGRDHAGSGQELAHRRRMKRGGVVRHCGGFSRRRSGTDGGAGRWEDSADGGVGRAAGGGDTSARGSCAVCVCLGDWGRQRRVRIGRV